MKENQITENWTPAVYIRENGEILDFKGLYEVSSLGRVKSLNYNHTGKAKVMCPQASEGNDGSIYYQVCLHKDGKKYVILVHRLVLSSFDQEGWSLGAVVNHKIERTPTSCINKLSNLEWTTQKENVNTEHCKELHAASMKGKLVNRKDLSKAVKMTDTSTGEVTVYPSTIEAERVLGIPRSTVSQVIKKQKGYYKKLNLHFAYV